jgi:hypothetical protein
MSIEGLIGGVMLLVASVSDGSVDSRTVYQSAILIDKAIIKTQSGTWSASAHEEGHSGLKNIILKLGRQ